MTTSDDNINNGVVGFGAGPVGSAALLGLAAGAIAAAAVWAAPAVQLMAALPADWGGEES